LQAERDIAWSERDAAQAEIEKLRLLIRQLQRGRFGHLSEKLDERVVSGRTKAHELARLLPWAWQAEQVAAAVDARTPRRSDGACRSVLD
jgi:hypothetical protein